MRVLVIVVNVLDQTVEMALNFVLTDVVVVVTLGGVTVEILVIVVDGSVMFRVRGGNVVAYVLDTVVLTVAEGVIVRLKTAVGVAVIVV